MNTNQLAGNSMSQEKPEAESLRTSLLEEFSALPEKFFTFTHEGISEIWMHETIERPIRGMCQNQNDSSQENLKT